MLREITNVLTGIFFGLFPLLIVAGFGLAIYPLAPHAGGIAFIALLGLGGLFLGYKIFKKIQFTGPMELLTGAHATPELDELEANANSDHVRRSPSEYAELVSRSAHLCQEGTLRLFGEWFGKPYRNPLTILAAEYDGQTDKLLMTLSEGTQLTITKPRHIFEVGTYFKILEAASVEVTGFSSNLRLSMRGLSYLKFWPEGRSVKALTRGTDKKVRFDLSLSAPALMVYGNPNNLQGVGLETTTFSDGIKDE